jgi:O-antigen/teichoic acid export membrane protein
MLRQYALAAVDQVVVGGVTFVLHALLIRWWVPAEYGTFGLWLAAADVCLTCHNALVTTPLSVHLARQSRRFRRRHLELLLGTATLLGAAGAFLVTLLGALLLAWSGVVPVGAWFGGPAMAAGLLLRSHARALFFARGDAGAALLVDGAYAAATMTLLIGLKFAAGTPGAETVMLLLAATQAVPALVLFLPGRGAGAVLRRRTLRRYGRLWREARWSLAGALTTTVQIRAHAFLVAAMAGAEAYGVIMAGSLLVSPTRLVLQSWSVVARPAMAAAIARGDRHLMLRIPVLTLGAFVAGYLLLAVVLYVFWDIVRQVFYAQMPDAIGPVVLTWVVFIGLFNVGDIFGTALQSFLHFRPLAYTTVAGSLIVLVTTPILILALGYPMALLGPCLAQLVAVAWMVRLYHDGLRALPQQHALGERA